MLDRVDRRVLGAIEVQDGVTGQRLNRPVKMTSEEASTTRTLGGLYAITAADGLEDHLEAFEEPPTTTAIDALTRMFLIEDPLGEYLPVLTAVRLPRSPAPGPGQSDRFQPHPGPLPSAPARRIGQGWVAVRVSLTQTNGDPVRGAYLEVLPAGGGDRLAWGITDRRGEGLVPVPSIPLLREVDNTPLDPDDPDDVVTDQTSVSLTAIADPAQPWPVNPDRLSADRATLRSVSFPSLVALTAGGQTHHRMTIDLT